MKRTNRDNKQKQSLSLSLSLSLSNCPFDLYVRVYCSLFDLSLNSIQLSVVYNLAMT